MFFRRKQKKAQDSPLIRTALSLPDINNQCIPWPEDLVDIAAIRESPSPDSDGLREVPGRGSTSTIFTSNPPSAFDRLKNVIKPTGRPSQRRARIPPTFNLMVVGGKQTGKTSLLRLLLETADISPAATAGQRSAVDQFLRSSFKSTSSIQSACVEICESRFDRILFSVIDTPGLDFQEGKELKLERQITSILKYIDTQYADTMSEESKVVRQSKGDQHVHLCIYMIDPVSITTASAGRGLLGLPTKARSETTISLRNPPELIDDTSSGVDSDDVEEEMAVSPAEIRVIRRLAQRTNVLPVIAHADSLTDDVLNTVKVAVRKALSDAGLGFGILDQSHHSLSPKPSVQDIRAKGSNGDTNDNGCSSEASEDEERRSRPVIKLRMPRIGTKSSQARSARDLSQVAEDPRRPISPDSTDPDSVANVRFSAHAIAKGDWSSLMPFALIAPEATIRRHRQLSIDDGRVSGPSSAYDRSEDGHDGSVEGVPQTPISTSTSKTLPTPQGPPDDLKGVFVRKFRWGTIDVLDPTHCDFAALRTVVLSTHMKMLKIHTKEVLYEKYRTEKLLVRRATQRISEEQTQRLLNEMGL